MQKVPSEVLSFAKGQGFNSVSYVMEWEGASVYIAEQKSDKVLCVGYPSYIKFVGGTSSWLDRAATISILKELA